MLNIGRSIQWVSNDGFDKGVRRQMKEINDCYNDNNETKRKTTVLSYWEEGLVK